jgi:hypothetical protein
LVLNQENGSLQFLAPGVLPGDGRALQSFKLSIIDDADCNTSPKSTELRDWVAGHLEYGGVAIPPTLLVGEYFKGFFAYAYRKLRLEHWLRSGEDRLRVVITSPACWGQNI